MVAVAASVHKALPSADKLLVLTCWQMTWENFALRPNSLYIDIYNHHCERQLDGLISVLVMSDCETTLQMSFGVQYSAEKLRYTYVPHVLHIGQHQSAWALSLQMLHEAISNCPLFLSMTAHSAELCIQHKSKIRLPLAKQQHPAPAQWNLKASRGFRER